MHLILRTLPMLVIASCATSGPASDFVKVAAADHEVASCTLLGEVRGDHNMFGGMMVQVAIDDATSQLKNKTANMGGNTVLITRSSAHWAGANMAGKAYRC
jgi:hypothetical protein